MDWLKQFSPQRESGTTREPIALPVSGFTPSEPGLVQRAMATGMAYELAMDSFFGASHAIRPSGERHTHSFRVQAVFVIEEYGQSGPMLMWRISIWRFTVGPQGKSQAAQDVTAKSI